MNKLRNNMGDAVEEKKEKVCISKFFFLSSCNGNVLEKEKVVV